MKIKFLYIKKIIILFLFLSFSSTYFLHKYYLKNLQFKSNVKLIIADVRAGNHYKVGHGLGNQFFTFALAYSHAKELGVKDLVINNFNKCEGKAEDFSSTDKRCYALDKFGIKNRVMYNFDKLSKKKYEKAYKITSLKQLAKKYNNDILIVTPIFEKKIYDYIKKYKNEIKAIIKYQSPLSLEAKNILNEINAINSVSLHVRRGDYAQHGWLYPLEYQIKAAYLIASKIHNPKFFIFTDDIKYVKEYFKDRSKLKVSSNYDHSVNPDKIYELLNNNVVYVSDKVSSSLEEFHLMSNCKHNIISNSTFSWWAAFLNKNTSKIVVAPSGFYLSRIEENDWILI